MSSMSPCMYSFTLAKSTYLTVPSGKKTAKSRVIANLRKSAVHSAMKESVYKFMKKRIFSAHTGL